MFSNRSKLVQDVPDIQNFSIDEVCEWIIALGLDPRPFKENAVEGPDLLELSDQEFQDYLGLKPLQIKKLRKKIEESQPGAGAGSGAGEEEEAPTQSIYAKYQSQLQQSYDIGNGASYSAPQSDYGYGGNDSAQNSSYSGGNDYSSGTSKFSSTDVRESNYEKPAIDYSTMQPCERGLAEGVYAEEGQEEADRNEDFEKTMYGGQSTGIDFEKYAEIPAEATGNNVPQPITSFAQAGFHKLLMENINLAKYKTPTPVQRYGIAVINAGRDLMACAQTGSGKTAAFLFPILSALLKRGISRADAINEELGGIRRMAMPDATIICPTRELALQIFDECRKFSYRSYVRPVVVYGGAASRGQNDMLRKGCHILIATPGRLNQMVEKRNIGLQRSMFFVLDEADRMLDMGFEPQIRQIVENNGLPETGKRQTMMFSATFPKEIQTLAGEFLHDYVFLTVGRVGAASTTIQQKIDYVEEGDKHDTLIKLLDTNKTGLTLIFVQTKAQADTLENYLSRLGYPSTSIHGDRAQYEREEALSEFTKGTKPILVATDVAQRGLDIPNVQHVINFDMPASIDDYVHRIGRTGRVGNHGIATSFFNDADTPLAEDLVDILKEAKQEVPEWLQLCADEVSRGGNRTKTRYKTGGRDARPQRRENGGGGFGDSSYGGGSSETYSEYTPSSGGDDMW